MTKLFKFAVAAVFAFAYGNAYAFHSGGVAECNGCHTMHGSYEGVAPTDHNNTPIAALFEAPGPYLLKGSDQSSACLNCHSGTTKSTYNVFTHNDMSVSTNVPLNYTAGGDFAWLEKEYSWEVRSGTFEESKGERKGHNVVAADYGLHADAAFSAIGAAPGGTFDPSKLACSSCHDPHGKYRRNTDGSITTTGLPIIGSGSYNNSKDPTSWGAVGVFRILGGEGFAPVSYPSVPFVNEPPAAVANSKYNTAETDTTVMRVAYGAGMSEWCANCHGRFHAAETYTSGSTEGLKHPAGNTDKLTAAIAANYDSYVKSGTLTGAAATSYSTLAPFEEGTSDYATLKGHTGNVKTGPTAGSANVSCMSCHRAHASGFDSMLRFPLSADYMTAADATGAPTFGDPTAAPGTDEVKVAMGRTNAEMTAALYGRSPASFAPFQRAYCNKCHVKD